MVTKVDIVTVEDDLADGVTYWFSQGDNDPDEVVAADDEIEVTDENDTAADDEETLIEEFVTDPR